MCWNKNTKLKRENIGARKKNAQFNKKKNTQSLPFICTHIHAVKESHKSQAHIPQCAVFTAEKTDWACLFVGSPLHVCLLYFSQWKTSILRIIKWLKRPLLIGCVCLLNVCLCACESVRVNMREHVYESLFGWASGHVLIHPWQAGTKADMISCVSEKAGAAIQSLMSPNKTSRLPVNRLAGRSSSTVVADKIVCCQCVTCSQNEETSPLTEPHSDWITFLQRIWISRQLNEGNVSHTEQQLWLQGYYKALRYVRYH